MSVSIKIHKGEISISVLTKQNLSRLAILAVSIRLRSSSVLLRASLYLDPVAGSSSAVYYTHRWMEVAFDKNPLTFT